MNNDWAMETIFLNEAKNFVHVNGVRSIHLRAEKHKQN